jgi:glutamyl-Q tRNA(Asp) synthetase
MVPWFSRASRLDLYQHAIDKLLASGDAYLCSCTRRDIGATDDEGGYAGTCRSGSGKPGVDHAISSRPASRRHRSSIGLQGPVDIDASALGDPIIRRRDGLYAYQLAVVVDDADQGVTDVVRGSDLLPSTCLAALAAARTGICRNRATRTCRWCASRMAASCPSPRVQSIQYPGNRQARASLWRVLSLLRQAPPQELQRAPLPETWDWAIGHWRLGALRGVASLAAD